MDLILRHHQTTEHKLFTKKGVGIHAISKGLELEFVQGTNQVSNRICPPIIRLEIGGIQVKHDVCRISIAVSGPGHVRFQICRGVSKIVCNERVVMGECELASVTIW